jgi:hypothetical protein
VAFRVISWIFLVHGIRSTKPHEESRNSKLFFHSMKTCEHGSLWKSYFRAATLARRQARRRAALLKSAFQFLGDLFRSSAFDLMAFHHVYELAIFQESD